MNVRGKTVDDMRQPPDCDAALMRALPAGAQGGAFASDADDPR
jgi:hypothetical protein